MTVDRNFTESARAPQLGTALKRRSVAKPVPIQTAWTHSIGVLRHGRQICAVYYHETARRRDSELSAVSRPSIEKRRMFFSPSVRRVLHFYGAPTTVTCASGCRPIEPLWWMRQRRWVIYGRRRMISGMHKAMFTYTRRWGRWFSLQEGMGTQRAETGICKA